MSRSSEKKAREKNLASVYRAVRDVFADGRREGVESCLRILEDSAGYTSKDQAKNIRREMERRGWL